LTFGEVTSKITVASFLTHWSAFNITWQSAFCAVHQQRNLLASQQTNITQPHLTLVAAHLLKISCPKLKTCYNVNDQLCSASNASNLLSNESLACCPAGSSIGRAPPRIFSNAPPSLETPSTQHVSQHAHCTVSFNSSRWPACLPQIYCLHSLSDTILAGNSLASMFRCSSFCCEE